MARKSGMGRETAAMLAVATAVGGFFAGRLTSGGDAGKAGQDGAAQVAPQAVEKYEEKKTEYAASPYKGAEDAPIVVTEVSDFQCPFCSRAVETINKVVEAYKGDVRVVFKHNALSFHKDARPAAIASMAAAKQGKFWAYHDVLFANAKALKKEDLIKYAGQVELDVAQFTKDLDDEALAAKVDNDQRAAVWLGATRTPSFFVNGVKAESPVWESVKAQVDKELVEVKKLQDAGVPRGEIAHRRTLASARGGDFVKYLMHQERAPEKPKPEAKPSPKDDTTTVWKLPVDVAKDPIKGPKDAPITIMEFSEFQCPFCSKVRPNIDAALKKWPDKVRVVFKQFPLAFHKDAPLASEAALAAHAEGKFWEMEAKLFDGGTQNIKRPNLETYAEELGLNMEAFKKALDEGTYKAAIKADQDLGAKAQVTGTPTLFLNGRRMGGREIGDFEAMIKEEEKKIEALTKKGIAKDKIYDALIKDGKEFTPPPPLEPTVNSIANAGSPFKGAADAKIVITEWSDFECPFCGRITDAIHQLVGKYPEQVKFVFRQFPLSFHKQAQKAAEASLAAHAQGKFWEYHDLLFANMKALEVPNLIKYAEQVGLDVAKFTAELNADKYADQVKKDIAAGQAVGVRGTPTMFVNGRKCNNCRSLADFESSLETVGLKKK